jgi:hypothetical protein
MESECLLPCSQKAAIDPYTEADELSTHTSILYNVRFNIISSTRLTSCLSLSLSCVFRPDLYAFVISPIRALCPVILILLPC